MEYSHSIQNKLDELKTISLNYVIIIILETWLTNQNKKIYLPNFNLIRNDREVKNKNNNTNEHGGICIFIKKNIPYEEVCDFYSIANQLETAAT